MGAVIHTLNGQGQGTCLEALEQQGSDLAHSQHGSQTPLQIVGRNTVALFGDGEGDHLQGGLAEDLDQTGPVAFELVVGLQALNDGADDLLLDVAGGLQRNQQGQVAVGSIGLVDDLVVEGFRNDDAAVILAGVENIVQNGSGESTENVAGAEVHPGGLLIGLGSHSLDVVLGQFIALCLPLLGIIGAIENVNQFHVENSSVKFGSDDYRVVLVPAFLSSISQAPSIYMMPRARSYRP